MNKNNNKITDIYAIENIVIGQKKTTILHILNQKWHEIYIFDCRI